MKNYFAALVVLSMLLCFACEPIISPNVTDSSPAINSPSDSLYSSQAKVIFWWDTDTKANAYRLQVASPSFNDPVTLVDTLTTSNKVQLTLAEGLYQWRIRLDNKSSAGAYITRSFVIDRTAPVAVEQQFPLDSAVLTLEDSLLMWRSQDKPINNITFPTADSLYIWRTQGTAKVLLFAAYIPFGANKIYRLPLLISDTVPYYWSIKTFDQAQNTAASGFRSFFIR